MPLYEYRCPACERSLEVLQRLGENGAHLLCPECGHQGLDRELSTFAAASASTSGSFAGPPPSCGGGSGFT